MILWPQKRQFCHTCILNLVHSCEFMVKKGTFSQLFNLEKNMSSNNFRKSDKNYQIIKYVFIHILKEIIKPKLHTTAPHLRALREISI